MTASLVPIFAVVIGLVALIAVGALFGVREIQARVADLDYRIYCNDHDLQRVSEDVARLEIRVDDCVVERVTNPYFREEKDDGGDDEEPEL